MERMADDQLAELRDLRDNYQNSKRGYGAMGLVPLWKLVSAVVEIDRLLAENAELRRERNDWRDIAEEKR